MPSLRGTLVMKPVLAGYLGPSGAEASGALALGAATLSCEGLGLDLEPWLSAALLGAENARGV